MLEQAKALFAKIGESGIYNIGILAKDFATNGSSRWIAAAGTTMHRDDTTLMVFD